MITTLLTGGTVVSLDPARVETRDLILTEERIGDPQVKIPTTSTVDCSGCLLMPGLVVAHTHLYSALARGMPGPAQPTRTFREILEGVWWRLDRALDAESLAASALIGAIEAVKAGVTCVIDHHESPSFIDGSLDVIAAEMKKVGVRGVLAYGATDRHGAEDAVKGLNESARFAAASAKDPLLRGMIGLHAPFTASDATLERAASFGRGVHVHTAEGPDDQAAAMERWKKPLFLELDRLGLLTERSICAHAVQIDDEEAALIPARKTWITHQARSNMNNGVGYASKLDAIDRVALGTDGIDNDLFAELRAAFFRRREFTGPTVWRDPVAMLASGHTLASELFEAPIGRLDPGAPADVVVLAYDPPSPLDAGNLGGHLLFGGLSSACVRDVFIAGKPVVRNRRMVGIDEREIAARTRDVAARLWRRMS